MRLFCYYTWHSFVNTIRRVLKTWVAIMLACLALGVVVGLIVSVAIPDSDDKEKPETSIEQVSPDDAENSEAEITVSKKDKDKEMGFLKERGKTKADLVDLIVSAVFFLSLAMNISQANKSGKIFKPADVPMLFATPMKPQSVMMFRLIGTLAASLMLSLYMLFQLPNLIYNVGLGVWGAFSLIIAYALILIFGTLCQVAFYTVMSGTKRGSKGLSTYVLIAYGILAAAFGGYVVATGKDLLTAAFDFFGSKSTFWVPFWGWMRGLCYYAITGEVAQSLLYIALFIFACGLIVAFIWKMKADFYEDALYETERQAALLENAKNAASGVATTREKDRSAKLERDGFHRGFGASVFFHKALFNQRRFAKFGIFSKTTIVFTVAAAFAALFATRSDIGIDLFIIPACCLGVLMFYRTLGNPLQEDTSREFFVLIPESPIIKIWYSLLGSLAVNAIDLVIPMAVAGIILRTNPLTIIGWFIFILSISMFGTAVGTFVNISVPGEHAQTIKVFAQIMLLYFGVLPSAIFVIIGTVMHLPLIPFLVGSIFNVAIGMLFTLMTPHFLTNR